MASPRAIAIKQQNAMDEINRKLDLIMNELGIKPDGPADGEPLPTSPLVSPTAMPETPATPATDTATATVEPVKAS